MPETDLIESEETLVIETPERVRLEFALASIGNRFLAVLVDHFIQFLFVILVVWTAYNAAGLTGGLEEEFGKISSEAAKWVIALMILGVFAVFSGYFVFFEWLWNGQTPGKRLMKLRVIREDGRPVTLWEVLARNLLRIFDNFPGTVIPLYSVGLITLFFSRRDQRIGDLFAGTVVIRERIDEAPTFAETFEARTSDSALLRIAGPVDFTADLTRLSRGEVDVAEAFLRRRLDLDRKHREWLAWRVALPIMYKLTPEYTAEGFSYEGFLEELVHRYNALSRKID
jgi:uncharacterized RDD family membrane protein YckC